MLIKTYSYGINNQLGLETKWEIILYERILMLHSFWFSLPISTTIFFSKGMMKHKCYTLSLHTLREWWNRNVILLPITPSLVMLLQQGGNSDVDQPLFLELFIVMQFSLQKLQDPEFVFKLESREDTAVIQV